MVGLEKNLILTSNSYSHINLKVAIKKNQIKELGFAFKQQSVYIIDHNTVLKCVNFCHLAIFNYVKIVMFMREIISMTLEGKEMVFT